MSASYEVSWLDGRLLQKILQHRPDFGKRLRVSSGCHLMDCLVVNKVRQTLVLIVAAKLGLEGAEEELIAFKSADLVVCIQCKYYNLLIDQTKR
jgi:hypothetical protein